MSVQDLASLLEPLRVQAETRIKQERSGPLNLGCMSTERRFNQFKKELRRRAWPGFSAIELTKVVGSVG